MNSQFRSQQVVAEYSKEIRQQDRDQIFAERRRRQREIEIDVKQKFDFKQFPSLIQIYMDDSYCDEVRFNLLIAGLQFTDDDDHSHYAVKQLLEARGLVNQLRETVYNENTKLEYRAQSLQLLAQMLYSNYELCKQLIEQDILILMINQAKIAFQHANIRFMGLALLGLANGITHDAKIREYYLEQEIDKLILQILERYDDEEIKKNTARIMNDWFRNTPKNINIELFQKILFHIINIPNSENKDYMEDLIWFIYGFISHSLDQLKTTDGVDPFIESLVMNPKITEFLKLKLQDTQYLGCVACIRTFIKIFKMISNQAKLQSIFYDDIRLLFRRAQHFEVNITKQEVLKLMHIMHQHPGCKIIAEEFDATLKYFSSSLKCQEHTLLVLKDCHIEIFSFSQLDTILQLCKNVLMSDLRDTNKLIAVLTILLKLGYDNLQLQILEVLPQIESLAMSENNDLRQIAHAFIENYTLFHQK